MNTAIIDPAHTDAGSYEPSWKQGEMLEHLRNDPAIHFETMELVAIAYDMMVDFHASGEALGRDVMGLWIDQVSDDLADWIGRIRDDLLDDPVKAARHDRKLRAIAMIGTFFAGDWMNVAAHLIEEWAENALAEAAES